MTGPGLGPMGPIELLLLATIWLLPILAAVVLVVAMWRMMKAQEATAQALREMADTLRRQGP